MAGGNANRHCAKLHVFRNVLCTPPQFGWSRNESLNVCSYFQIALVTELALMVYCFKGIIANAVSGLLTRSLWRSAFTFSNLLLLYQNHNITLRSTLFFLLFS